MSANKPKVLMVVEQCNPQWASVPLVAFKLYDEVSKLVDVTLVTHERNKSGIEPIRNGRKVHYILENKLLTKYFGWTDRLVNRGAINWPLYHMLNYPVYAGFNRLVHKQFKQSVAAGEYDIVHALTPMMPRYPVRLIDACKKTPFVLGPVNGGVPFPKGFEVTARKEFAHFNFLRALGRRLIPGYKKTYTKASKILVGSAYTKDMIKSMFNLEEEKLISFSENGIEPGFVSEAKQFSKNKLKLLFVGRLVPYKGADMLLSAVIGLQEQYRNKIEITIVGDGPERPGLEKQCADGAFADRVKFTGWVEQKDTLGYYREADIFCFPSIREFGGAVVLEAMANGLPCIVVNNGGIGEYVSDEAGYKIEPNSRKFIVQSISNILIQILDGEVNMHEKSNLSIARVKNFCWDAKGLKMTKIYNDLLSGKHN